MPVLQSHGVLQGAVSGVVGTARGIGRSVKRLGVSAVTGAKALLSTAASPQQQQDMAEAQVSEVNFQRLQQKASTSPAWQSTQL